MSAPSGLRSEAKTLLLKVTAVRARAIKCFWMPEPAFSIPEPSFSMPEPVFSMPEPAFSIPDPAFSIPDPLFSIIQRVMIILLILGLWCPLVKNKCHSYSAGQRFRCLPDLL